jgi:hypothetical protein
MATGGKLDFFYILYNPEKYSGGQKPEPFGDWQMNNCWCMK